MAQEAVIALDQGSSSSRAVAFNARGRILAKAQVPLRVFNPKPGWVEHDPEDIGRSQERALNAALGRLAGSVRVLGIGIAAQRSTFVLWDSKTGKPLAPAPSWQDSRASGAARNLAEHRAFVHERTGLYLTPYYSAPKLAWLLAHRPRVRKMMEAGRLRMGPVATYLLWRLTGGEAFLVDPTMAQRTLLFDIHQGRWDPRLLSLFGVYESALPAVCASTGSLGSFRYRGRNIPILAMLGDQQSAALGLGADSEGRGIFNYGTGAFFLLNTGTEERRVRGFLTSVAWQRRGESFHFFQEGTVHASGTSFRWLKENLGILSDVRDVERLCRESRNRIFALNAVGGLGAPRWDYETPSAWTGLNAATGRADVVRGVTEGIAFLLAEIVYALRLAGLPIESLNAAGGLSRIDYLLEFQAGLIQAPIARMREVEATAVGAASLAAQEAGAPWARGLRAGRADRTFRPRMSRREALRLVQAWKIFVEMQQNLSVAMRKLGVQ